MFFFFKQKTAYEMRISDWSSDVCSSDLLVVSKHGAKGFADARPAPSAEWMGVFDPNVRYGEPRKRSWNDEEEIDPLDLFGLDDDPPRPPKEANGQRTIPGFNPLNWKHGDASFPERTGLRGWNWQWAKDRKSTRMNS